jgi:hypothetical protein
VTRRLVLEPGDNAPLAVSFDDPPASVRLETSPVGGRVEIDGEEIGFAPLTAEGLIPGTHHVRVTKEGYQTQEMTLDLVAGATESRTLTLERPVPVPPFLARLGEVEALLDEGLPMKAWDRWESIVEEGGVPEGLTAVERDRFARIRRDVSEKAHRLDLSVRFGGEEGLRIRGGATIRGAPTPVKGAGFSMRVRGPLRDPLRIALFEFRLVAAESRRILPAQEEAEPEDGLLPEMQGEWSRDVPPEPIGLRLFILIARPVETSLSDLNAVAARAVATEVTDPIKRGHEVYRTLRDHLESLGGDFGLRILWADGRTAG